MLDFEAIKQIPVADVAAVHYHLHLVSKGEYANCACPLPTHKQGDRAKSFSINVRDNYWRCFSASCNENNGGKKGGDVINFVALMERCREKDAAEKLADWYGLNGNKAAPLIERRPEVPHIETHRKDSPDHNPSSDSVKYMQEVDAWFDGLMKRGESEDEAAYWKRFRNGVKSKLIESYKNGKKAK